MGDNVRVTAAFMAWGLRDSIKGIANVFTLDKDLAAAAASESSLASTTSGESAQPQSTLARRRAAKRGTQETSQKQDEPKVLHRIFLCCAWNGGLFMLSILLFYGFVLPTLQGLTNLIFGGSSTHSAVWWWLGPMLSWTFNALWILPLFVLSKVINSLWFQDIADAAYRKSRGRPQLPSLGKIIADILFSVLLQAFFLVQGMLASLLPIGGLGYIVCLIHNCLLYSLYAFEYKWFNMGWEVQKRLLYIESNWPYFVGFGLPLALFTSISSSHVINGCLFSVAFPLFIISSNEAKPLHQTYDFPVRFFSVVVTISNAVFQRSVRKTHSTPVPMPTGTDRAGTPPTDRTSKHGGTPTKRVTLQR